MSKIVGVVESKYGENKIKIDGAWYQNKFKTLPDGVERGSTVEVECKEGTTFWNKVTVVGKAANSPTGGGGRGGYESSDRQSSIVRQNALTNATNLYVHIANTMTDVEDTEVVGRIIQIARGFELYTSGELDKKEAKEFEDE